MRPPIMTVAGLLAALAIGACAPAFNWRQITISGTSLSAVFPCKPERSVRAVSMAGGMVELHMDHCDTAGVTAAVGHARVSEPALAGAALAQWRVATLSAMRVAASSQSPWTMAHAPAIPQSVSVEARGTTAQGEPLQLKAAWFARGPDVYAALLYGPSIDAEVAQVFFSGLRLQ